MKLGSRAFLRSRPPNKVGPWLNRAPHHFTLAVGFDDLVTFILTYLQILHSSFIIHKLPIKPFAATPWPFHLLTLTSTITHV